MSFGRRILKTMSPPEGQPQGRAFPVTSWSLICQLKDPASAERERHLRRLVSLYWKPVYCVFRHAWARSDQDAEDLTQQFFVSVVLEGNLIASVARERGSFRAFLKGAIFRFSMAERRRTQRVKRGGGVQLIPLGEGPLRVDDLVAGVAQMTPEQVFDAAWSRIVVARALDLLEARFRGDGKPQHIEVFRRYELASPTVASSYREVAEALGLTPDRVKHALDETRVAFRDIVTGLVAEYVDGPEELQAELGRLLGG